MKRLFIITAFLLFAGISFGQTLKKGCILGVHNITITLEDGATMDQFIEAVNSYLEGASKYLEGWSGYLVKGFKGEKKNELGMVWYIESMKAHDRYLNKDNSWTEEFNKAGEKIQPYIDEIQKYGTWTSTFTDWKIL